MKEVRVNANSKVSESKKIDRFKGKTFLIAGILLIKKRDEAAFIIESYAGKVSGSVSKKTSYVVAGEEAGSKLIGTPQFRDNNNFKKSNLEI